MKGLFFSVILLALILPFEVYAYKPNSCSTTTQNFSRRLDQRHHNPKFHEVVKVIFEERDYVFLIKRAEPPFLAHWDLPGGHIEEGESLRSAAHRELFEELGVYIHQLEAKSRMLVQTQELRRPIHIHLVRAHIYGNSIGPIDRYEVADFQWFHRDDLPADMVPLLRQHLMRGREWTERFRTPTTFGRSIEK